MAQCPALWYPNRRSIGFYCVLDEKHRGAHQTTDGRAFPESENVARPKPMDSEERR